MKKLFILFTLFILFSLGSHTNAQNSIYLGGELLSPVGINGKADLNENYFLSTTLGLFLSENSNVATIEVSAHRYLRYSDFKVESGELLPYAGIGFAIRLSDQVDEQIALRMPAGLEYKIEDTPFEIYMDAGPYINIVDSFSFSFDSSLGFRYKF